MPDTVLKQAEDKMKKAIEAYQEELKTIRTGRPNPEIFKKVQVECYGAKMGLFDVATISVPDGQSFLIQPFDKTNLKSIEAGINNSGLGFNANNDGDNIRIVIPPLSKERRQEMIKKVSSLTEERGHVSVRNIRQSAKDEIKKLKDTGLSEDVIKKAQDNLEKLTSDYNKKVDSIAKAKEEELTKV